eukprot:CAMPEP_0168442484 /NCGR_PEP_ID=MMETSP0228-20121227/44034_1 /TAXON_ID=133427 /ORGANISM="Protoceratium reticulatum, Strain CCCM 535 (=CCMP 1889)" /LENGTH=80 /DNA_ID=CAMNT_0008456851 /DNA_START=97 /DNA_END=339 /DNA_ORIENTATION=-
MRHHAGHRPEQAMEKVTAGAGFTATPFLRRVLMPMAAAEAAATTAVATTDFWRCWQPAVMYSSGGCRRAEGLVPKTWAVA